MNVQLQNSCGRNYPEKFDGFLDSQSMAVTCAFNKLGTLLAVGCNNGMIIIWDFLTRSMGKVIPAHVRPVSSMSWSPSGYQIASGSTDNTVGIWEVISGECKQKFRFPSPVFKVQFDPKNMERLLVCPMIHAAVLVKTNRIHTVLPIDDDGDVNITATFDKRGDYVYTGNAKGKVLVFDSKTLEVRASFSIILGTSTAIRCIEFSRKGDCFLINATDRLIRVYDSNKVLAYGKDGKLEPIQILQDLVNNTKWKTCCFSGDGEYICAGSDNEHTLYIWRKSIGHIVQILHGTKEALLLDISWHPVCPIIASISAGVVSLWTQNKIENWSAFTPNVTVLDENMEYDELESEFDIEDEDKPVASGADNKEDVDIEVDVCGNGPFPDCCSDEENENSKYLRFLPIVPVIQNPENIWTSAATNLSPPKPEPPARKQKKSFDIAPEVTSDEEMLPLSSSQTKQKKGLGGKKAAK